MKNRKWARMIFPMLLLTVLAGCGNDPRDNAVLENTSYMSAYENVYYADIFDGVRYSKWGSPLSEIKEPAEGENLTYEDASLFGHTGILRYSGTDGKLDEAELTTDDVNVKDAQETLRDWTGQYGEPKLSNKGISDREGGFSAEWEAKKNGVSLTLRMYYDAMTKKLTIVAENQAAGAMQPADALATPSQSIPIELAVDYELCEFRVRWENPKSAADIRLVSPSGREYVKEGAADGEAVFQIERAGKGTWLVTAEGPNLGKVTVSGGAV